MPDYDSPLATRDDGPRTFSVSELTLRIKGLLESTFTSVWVAGEISNLSRPRSGHCYLTLKDDQAQLPAVLWRGTAGRLRFDLNDGLEVVCRGRLDVYPPRGRYQLIIEEIHPKGLGALELALRQLREKLAREGLFDDDRKRPLPRFPRRVAVVTSPTGAAIRDFLEVLRRRHAGVDVWVFPVRVQGEGAAEEIAAAIADANRLIDRPDCLVVTRGGGSLEDLWAFNEEVVVRAIAASAIPVISGVGHEVDVTLSDLAADVRALTPSEAAERVAPAAEEIRAQLSHHRDRMSAALRSRLTESGLRLQTIESSPAFRRPLDRIFEMSRRLDELDARSARAMGARLESSRRSVVSLSAQLESLSPLAVLKRGYSLTQRADDGQVVRSASDLEIGQSIRTRLARGEVVSRVEEMELEG